MIEDRITQWAMGPPPGEVVGSFAPKLRIRNVSSTPSINLRSVGGKLLCRVQHCS
jgi:hypothetical protein